MKRFIPILILVIFIASLSPLSCVTSRDIHVNISCDQFAEDHSMIQEYQIEIGDKIIIRLCSNPTTGFEWKYETSADNILIEEDHDFEESKENVAGASGIEVWTFEAKANGITEIDMVYSKSSAVEQVEWSFTMFVTVE